MRDLPELTASVMNSVWSIWVSGYLGIWLVNGDWLGRHGSKASLGTTTSWPTQLAALVVSMSKKSGRLRTDSLLLFRSNTGEALVGENCRTGNVDKH